MQTAQNLCKHRSPDWNVGRVSISGLAFLAPMSGVSDLAMRRIAIRFGAALAPSEMVACESFVAGEREASLRAEGHLRVAE